MNTADSTLRLAGLPATIVDDERFQVHSRLEILAILRGLVDQGEFATIHIGDGSDFIVTMVLAVNPEFEEVVLDCGAHDAANRRVLEADHLLVVSQLAQIRVQFAVGHADATTFDGMPALRVRLPSMLTRLQRRDCYRVRVAGARALRCEFPPPDEGSVRRPAARVIDISCGGLGLTELPDAVQWETGTIHRGCRLSLPEVGTLVFDVEIVRVSGVSALQPPANRRAGVHFVGLSDATRAQLQRFINRIEREQLAKE